VITWLSCFNKVMSGDKLGYLFGKIIPALSLVFSMTLRFVPRFRDQIIEISNAQKCIGKGVENGKIIERFKNGIAILSILITWSLEDAIETSNSMKSRGYGLKGRTHFSIYQLEKRDVFILGILLLITIGMFWGTYLGITNIQFFPMIIVNPISFTSILIFIIFLILVSLPMILNVWEEIKWKSIK
jgi:energy-coupling factor transport system permease protein